MRVSAFIPPSRPNCCSRQHSLRASKSSFREPIKDEGEKEGTCVNMHSVEPLWACRDVFLLLLRTRIVSGSQGGFFYLRRVFSGKDVVTGSRAVHLLLGGDVKDATLDGDVDGQASIAAVVPGEFLDGEYFGHVGIGNECWGKKERKGRMMRMKREREKKEKKSRGRGGEQSDKEPRRRSHSVAH